MTISRFLKILVVALLLSGCGSSNKQLACDPAANEEYLVCLLGKKKYKFRNPSNTTGDPLNPEPFKCASNQELEIYWTQCLQGLPVPEIAVCSYSSPNRISCPHGTFDAFTMQGYTCTSEKYFIRMIQKCAGVE